MSALRHLDGELEELRGAGLLRTPPPVPPVGALVLCSNDYLGYAGEPLPSATAPAGAGASRLISGDHGAHHALEATIARWLDCEAALVFSSGYAAGLGTLAALAGPGDLVVSDELNHASLIDGCRLSRATVRIVPHLSPAAVDEALRSHRGGRRWVVTESYFSMDGNGPDLAALRRICDAHDAALIVDEAHALGVFGPRGRGLCRAAGVVPDVLIGTLGKALGVQGAFVAGPRVLRSWLWNRARSFVFSTGMSPALAQAASARIERAAGDDAARARLAALGERVRRELAGLRVPIAPSHGPVLPWIVGDAAAASALSRALLEQGVFVQAIRPPTVPPATARLRLTLHARLGDDDIDRLLGVVERVMPQPKLADRDGDARRRSPRAPDPPA